MSDKKEGVPGVILTGPRASDGRPLDEGKWSLADVGVTPHVPAAPMPGLACEFPDCVYPDGHPSPHWDGGGCVAKFTDKWSGLSSSPGIAVHPSHMPTIVDVLEDDVSDGRMVQRLKAHDALVAWVREYLRLDSRRSSGVVTSGARVMTEAQLAALIEAAGQFTSATEDKKA